MTGVSSLDRPAAYRGPADRLALVQGIHDSSVPTVETDWLEAKREADLSTSEWQGRIATHILGFANRPATRAARVVGGYAYLVIGAESGRIRGVEPLDPAALEDGVGRFVGRGEEMPKWEPFYVMLEGQSVLVIVVDPPVDGHRPAPLRKTFMKGKQTVTDGTLFVRRGGKTVEASSAEVDELFSRGVSTTNAIAVRVEAGHPLTITPVDVSDDSVARWIDSERAALLADLHTRSHAPGTFGSTAMFGIMTGETRTREQYLEQVERYLARATGPVREHGAAWAVDAGIGRVDLRVANLTDQNFASVAVDLYVPGAVRGFFHDDDALPETALPRRPREWGSSPTSQLGLLATVPRVSPLHLHGGSIDNSASAAVEFAAVHVRPDHAPALDPVFLIADPSLAGQSIQATWRATSKSAAGVVEGTIAITVADNAVDLEGLMIAEPEEDRPGPER